MSEGGRGSVAVEGTGEALGADGGLADSGAGWAALLCGVHCLLAPALALASPALVLPTRYEQGAMLAIALVVAYVLAAGVRAHGRLQPVLPALAGAALWGLAVTEASGAAPEWAVAGAGGVILFVALRWNARLQACEAAERAGG